MSKVTTGMATMKINGKEQDDNSDNGRDQKEIFARIDEATGYISNIEDIRRLEYPSLHGTTYLDHAGTTPYAKSLIESYTTELTSNLFGNPHSASASSQLSTRRTDDIRLQVLRYFNADPDEFDVVFVANATAAIKLVADCFRDSDGGFWYGYHADAHTSLVGVREIATNGSVCFQDQSEIYQWLADLGSKSGSLQKLSLLAYPGQSNMTGERHSLDICAKIRDVSKSIGQSFYSLYDAAGILSTSSLDLSDAQKAPDFIALSFYKIFGYPDLGALIVRKASRDVLRRRKYFAGGTVEMVSAWDTTWHEKKETLHSSLEDGTPPFHNIIALGHALKTHAHIYGNMSNVSRHTQYLAEILFRRLAGLKHGNGKSICKIYSKPPQSASCGATIAFNLLDSSTRWVNNVEVEKLAIVRGIQLRIGGLCNPGGIAQHLGLSTEDMRQNFASGQRCGGGSGIMNGKPTGAIRVSLGAMSSLADVEKFINFLEEFYVDHNRPIQKLKSVLSSRVPRYFIESISVFPIKSCAGFEIPSNIDWTVHSKGLAWDREWCLVHQGTNIALSQKQYPSMTHLQPTIDLDRRTLKVTHPTTGSISINLEDYPDTSTYISKCSPFKSQYSTVCGQSVPIHLYTSTSISSFFTDALGVPCTLARHMSNSSPRYANIRKPKSSPPFSTLDAKTSIKLANESPILLVSRSSVNHLNAQIRKHKPSAPIILPSTFRANIVVTEINPSPSPSLYSSSSSSLSSSPSSTLSSISFPMSNTIPPSESETEIETETGIPYLEDEFTTLTIANNTNINTDSNPDPNQSSPTSSTFKLKSLGPCQRCQMICVDQSSGKRSSEPFSTLAKTRRKDGGVWFGIHLCLFDDECGDGERDGGKGEMKGRYVRVGDEVLAEIKDAVAEEQGAEEGLE